MQNKTRQKTPKSHDTEIALISAGGFLFVATVAAVITAPIWGTMMLYDAIKEALSDTGEPYQQNGSSCHQDRFFYKAEQNVAELQQTNIELSNR